MFGIGALQKWSKSGRFVPELPFCYLSYETDFKVGISTRCSEYSEWSLTRNLDGLMVYSLQSIIIFDPISDLQNIKVDLRKKPIICMMSSCTGE